MAFVGVPEETRKYFKNGTTIFERVLPGADRMYPDTDTAPIPLKDEYIEDLRKKIPTDIIDRYHQLVEWKIPEDTHNYIFKKNLFPLIEKIINELNINSKFVGTFFGHRLKFVEGHFIPSDKFNYKIIFAMFKFLQENKLDFLLAKQMLAVVYEHPKMDFESVLNSIDFKRIDREKIISKIPFLKEKFEEIKRSDDKKNKINWIMGQLQKIATGNINLTELEKIVKK